MEQALVYLAYAVAALGAVAIFVTLPREGQRSRKGLATTVLALAMGGFILMLNNLFGEFGRNVYFCLLALLALGGAVRVVTHPRPVYSALFFVLVVLSTAGLMVLVGAEFLAAALVIVYAGAILVTYVFVIMLAQQSSPTTGGQFAAALDYDKDAREPLAAVLAGFVLVGTLAGVIVSRKWEPIAGVSVGESANGNTLALGRVLLTDFAVSVELAGVLLMVAMIGAIAIARKKLPRGEHEEEMLPPGEIGRHVTPY
ncbi:MAG TPA: NADH-quinone oxidoreductase subunit J [Phycisphaerae bacterium]|nr:NADH-quinone oxidoreductase subunit J [Phycisphaerae bacterium]